MTAPRAASATPRPTIMAEDVAGPRADGHADPDLVRAARHRVRHHAVEAEGGQEDRHGGEEAEQRAC